MAPKTRTGCCCLGKRCKYPLHELCPSHTCPCCNKIVHIMCAKFDSITDKYVCLLCDNKKREQTISESRRCTRSSTQEDSTSSGLDVLASVAATVKSRSRKKSNKNAKVVIKKI